MRKLIFVIAALALSSTLSPSISMAAGKPIPVHTCTVPNTVYIPDIGCVLHITDPAELAKQIDLATGKPIEYRKDYDPNCDGKPSGHIYEIPTKNPVDGTIGVTAFQCD